MLNIIIVGAGIAGLSAAASLRRAGHVVHVYEKSSTKTETGAAIFVPPNAARVLLAWGVDPVRWRWVLNSRSDRLDASSLRPVFRLSDQESTMSMGGLPMWMAHRVDLHSALKWVATREDGPGTPAVLHFHAAVKGYDPSKPSIILDNGEEVRGHVVIAADGVHSAGPGAILGYPNRPVPTARGNCCYRFLIPVHRLQDDPETSFFVENHHGWSRILHDEDRDRKVVVYPCRDNTILNFACILHEDEEAKAQRDDTRRENWHEAVHVDRVSERLGGFDDRFLKVVAKATDVRRWPLLHRQPLPAWNKGRTTLAGDAAHPILPHLGQGGAQALEDGVALGIVFTGASSPDEVEDRLALYFGSRHRRTSAVQILSNVGGDHASGVGEELLQYMSQDEIPEDLPSTFRYCLAFDVVQATVDIMTKHDPQFRLADGFFEKPVIGVPKAGP
ncbi:hypothetical protein E4U42_000522 [Claviceps africana]|uniref:FAD-binding domain-containing protein n=1 Tax=Claviceps africana TaxID=83212 RepID=A0A8K0J0I9_9HYPO|nr:hypothetical protein E4U42_000522 [Claviceps africana]